MAVKTLKCAGEKCILIDLPVSIRFLAHVDAHYVWACTKASCTWKTLEPHKEDFSRHPFCIQEEKGQEDPVAAKTCRIARLHHRFSHGFRVLDARTISFAKACTCASNVGSKGFSTASNGLREENAHCAQALPRRGCTSIRSSGRH